MRTIHRRLASSGCRLATLSLLTHDFHNDSLIALTVKLSVENALPGPEIKLSRRDRDNHLVMNEKCLEMRVAVIFSGVMVPIILTEGGEPFKPLVDIFNQAALIVVDVDSGGDMHRGNQNHAFLHPTLSDDVFHLGCDVHVGPVSLGVELQIIGMNFHGSTSAELG